MRDIFQANKQLILSFIGVFLCFALLFSLVLSEKAFGATLSYSDNRNNPYSWIKYSKYSTTNFQVDGRPFFCAQGPKNTPLPGTVQVDTSPLAFENRFGYEKAQIIKKVLYYAPGGPGYESHKNLWDKRFSFYYNDDHPSLAIEGNRARVYAHEIISYLLVGDFGKGVKEPDRLNFMRHVIYPGTGTIGDEISRLNPDLENCVFGLVKGARASTQDIVGIWSYEGKGSIELQKLSADPDYTGELPDEYSLAGAVYEVWPSTESYETSTHIKEFTTDEKGYARVNELPLHASYYVQEKSPSKGFALDPQRYLVKLNDKLVKLHSTEPLHTPKRPPVGGLKILKRDEETSDKPQGEAQLAGAEFSCKFLSEEDAKRILGEETLAQGAAGISLSDEQFSQVLALDSYLWKTQSNAQGKAHIFADQFDETGRQQGIPLGYVAIWESKAPKGYELKTEPALYKVSKGPKNTSITAEGKDIIVTDKVIKAPLAIHKVLSYHQASKTQHIDFAGVNFEIYDAKDKLVETITTNEQGYAQSSALPYGHYKVQEVLSVEAQKYAQDKGITLDPASLFVRHIEITEASAAPLVFEAENSDLFFKLKLEKRDKDTHKLIESTAAYRLYDQNKEPLSWPDEHGLDQLDFYTSQGIVHFPHELSAGTYYVKESQAPAGYKLDENFYELTCSDISRAQENYDPKERVYTIIRTDERAIGKINLHKFDAESSSPLQGVQFAIYAAEDIHAPDGELIFASNSLVETVQTDAEGLASSKELPLGTYRVQEHKTAEGYYLDPTEHIVQLSAKDSKQGISYKSLEVANAPNNLVVKKLDRLNNQALAGAHFLLEAYKLPGKLPALAANKPEEVNELHKNKGVHKDKQENESNSVKTENEVGSKPLHNPEGRENNALKEDSNTKVTPPQAEDREGHAASRPEATKQEEEGSPHASKAAQPLKTSIKPARTHTAAEKATASPKPPVPTPLAPTQPKGSNAPLDIKTLERAVGQDLEIVTDDSGISYARGLKPGYLYKLTEIKAPEGYLIDAEAINYLTVSPEGAIVELSLTDQSVIQRSNEPLMMIERSNLPEIELEVSKKSITGNEELPGAKLALYQGEKLIKEWVSGDTPCHIKGLSAGNYTLKELEAPAGHMLAADISFTLEPSSEIQKVEMRDDIIRVEISKLDSASKEPVAGAELSLIEKESGKEVQRWSSGLKPQNFERINAGRYLIREINPPSSYKKGEDLEIEIKSIAGVQSFEYLNEKEPEEPKSYLPKTGDSSKASLFIGLGLLGLFCISKGARWLISASTKPTAKA